MNIRGYDIPYVIGYVGAGTIFFSLVAGTIYFTFKRFKISFFAAIFNPWILAYSVAISILMFVGQPKKSPNAAIVPTQIDTVHGSYARVSSGFNHLISNDFDKIH
jgi:hypothetical protein